MSKLSRRDVLRGGVAAAGLLATGGLFAGEASGSGLEGSARLRSLSRLGAVRMPDSLPHPALPAGTDTLPQIEHILVLMMENHSYDNYLGMLGRARGKTPRGDGFTVNGQFQPTNSSPYANGKRQVAFHMPTTCQLDGKPSQEWTASHEQYAGGANSGFVKSPSGPVAMGYWDASDLPFYYSLASTFPIADRWFCSLLGQTIPNRRFLLAATSAGMVDDLPFTALAAPNGTIFDRLDHYGISWRDYYHTTSNPTAGVWPKDTAASSPNVVSVDAFFTDCATGGLPSFAIIDPHFGTQSEEDPQDVATGEAFAAQVINALMESPSWSKTLLVWTYDEHGGYYDHVPPPAAIAPDAIAPVVPAGAKPYDGFARYGFRVPAAVVSPYAKRNYVSHVVYDHTSVLAMVERKWNLPALTKRDANAHDLLDFLSLKSPGFVEPPLLARPALTPAACETTGPGIIPPPGSIEAGAAPGAAPRAIRMAGAR
jgi:phospholipase C